MMKQYTMCKRLFAISFIEFRRSMAYTSEVVFSILASVVAILVQIALWSYLYRNNNEKIAYMLFYVVNSSVLNTFYSNDIYALISEKVTRGEFVLNMLKPISFLSLQYYRFLGRIAGKMLLKALPVLVIFSKILFSRGKLLYVIYSIPYLFLGHILFTLIYMIIGISSFVFIETWAFRRLMDNSISFFSGALIPLALFPSPWNEVLRLLPFSYLYDYPLRILLGDISLGAAYFQGIIQCTLWCFFVFGILIISYRKILRYVEVSGG